MKPAGASISTGQPPVKTHFSRFAMGRMADGQVTARWSLRQVGKSDFFDWGRRRKSAGGGGVENWGPKNLRSLPPHIVSNFLNSSFPQTYQGKRAQSIAPRIDLAS